MTIPSETSSTGELRSFWLSLERWLLWISIFILPWQLRHTAHFAYVNSAFYEYGSWHIYATDVVIISLVGVWLGFNRTSINFGPPSINYPLVGLGLWLTASALWSRDPAVTVFAALHFWIGYLLYLYIVNRVKDVASLLWPLISGLALQAAVGIWQYLQNHSLGLTWLGESVISPTQPGVPIVGEEGEAQIRAHGLLPHANILGGLLAAGLSASPYLYIRNLNPSLRRTIVYLSGIMAIGLALSFARSGWVAFGIVGAILLFMLGRSQKLKTVWPLTAMVLLGFIVPLVSQPGLVLDRLKAETRIERISVDARITGTLQWAEVFSSRPWLGQGGGRYTHALVVQNPAQPGWAYQPVHNSYLLLLGELGLIGGMISLWLLVAIWRITRRLFGRQMPAVVIGLGLSLLLVGLVDHWPVSLHQGQLFLFFALGLIILEHKLLLKEG